MGRILRRTFLVGIGAVAGGLAVGTWFVRTPHDNPLKALLADGEAAFGPFLTIAADNTMTVFTGRAEMGQGVSTTLAALVAEELDVPLSALKVSHGPASPAYYNAAMLEEGGPFAFYQRGWVAETARDTLGVAAKVLGIQVTGGSSSTRDAFQRMRHAGAAARHVLLSAAAEDWDTDMAMLETRNGEVLDRGEKRSATYGALAAKAAQIEPPSDIVLKPREEWRLLGQSQPRTDIPAKVDGSAVFGTDVLLDDMLFATVRISPVFGAAMERFDATKANQVDGVFRIVSLQTAAGNGFGVIARDTWTAFKAADLVEVAWSEPAYPPDDASISKVLDEALADGDGWALRDDGDATGEFEDAPEAKVLEAIYSVPYLAHAVMEPMNATARLKDGTFDLWAPNQGPTILQSACTAALGIDRYNVRVHTTFLGGGFGRRAEPDFAIYAAHLAKAAEGRPVKVTWTREEDMTHDTYRPAAKAHLQAKLDEKGYPQALDIRVAAPSVSKSAVSRIYPGTRTAGPDRLITEGAFDQPYAIPHYRVQGIAADIAIPVGFWRSVGYSHNGFFHECFMDEIAEAGGHDPIDLRLMLMAPWPSATSAVQRVASMAGWGDELAPSRARGIAFTLSFGTYVAQIVEVAQTEKGIMVTNVWCAADIGLALDPAIIRAQLMSGIVFGLSSAIGQEINFADGRVQQKNFDEFDAMRMHQCPKIAVDILQGGKHMGGIGEPGVPPSIPALANAIYKLTGKRIRQMPLSRDVDFV